MSKNFKKIDIVAVLVLIGLIAGFYIFNFGQVQASPGTVEFTEDVVLDLDPDLDTTTYIATGSKVDSLTISGADLNVYGIWDGIPFLLKTVTHKVLQLTPSGGTADLIFSSTYVSGGYVSQWSETSSVEVAHIVGVIDANSWYKVKVGGVLYGTYNSGASAEVSFSRTGSGISEIFTIEASLPPCQEHNVWGWAWSENIGWASFSCENESEIGQGIDYGVDIDEDTGIFSGYAWSENIGWIDFAPSGPYPAAPDYSAKVDVDTGEVFGWARVLNYDDSWDGWIKMSGADYGVWSDSNASPTEFHDWAWGSDVVGWISFNCANEDVCGVSDYKVMTSLSFVTAPSISNFDSAFFPCSQSRIPTFSWETDAELPYDYEIRLCSNLECTGDGDPLVLELKEGVTSTSWAPACTFACNISPYNSIVFGGGAYYGQVRVRNTDGPWSGWETSEFSTYNHAYPYPDFLCDGEDCEAENIYEETVISLTNNSFTYDDILSCSWDLPLMAEVVGRSLQFDGANDYVDAGSGASLTMTNAFTYEAWFKANNVSTYRVFLALGVGGAIPDTGDVRVQGNNVDAYWHGSGSVYGGRQGTTVLTTGTWYHVAVVFVSGQYPVIYLNGISEGATVGTAQTFAGTGWKAWIGKTLYADAAVPFNGLIDEVRIYNRALNPTEIEEHYVGIFSNNSGLVLNLPMDEVEGDTVYDKSSSANHGILRPDYPADSPTRVLGDSSFDCNIKIKFSAPPAGQRDQPVEFTVEDIANYSCSETKILGIRYPLPEYKEVSPVGWLKIFSANLFAGMVNALTGF